MQRKALTTIQKSVLFLGLIFIVSLFSVQKSYGEAAITVGDDVKIKFGLLMQGQVDESQLTNGDYYQNIFLRRVRFLIGGQLAPNLTFFMDTENPNLGKQSTNTPANTPQTNKNVGVTGLSTLDAILTWAPISPVNLDMGLMYVPLCRNCVQSAASLLPINFGANSFNESNATGSNSGRDTGLQARSYLLNDTLEIRLGAFQGYRTLNAGSTTTGSRDPFRMAARVQYNVFDAEKGFFYTGTYLGKKKVLAVGAGYDAQGEYKANAFDAFLDLPIPGNMAVTTQVDYIRYMPGTPAQFTTPSIAGGDQTDWLVEAGLYLSDLNLQPFVQYQDQQFVSGGPDTRIVQGGLAYYFAGYNGNLKLGAGYTDTGTTYGNQVTVQLQGFYF